jgi:hypothetical protein
MLKLEWIINQIETKIIQEIQLGLSGGTAAEESLAQARRILDATSAIKPNTE